MAKKKKTLLDRIKNAAKKVVNNANKKTSQKKTAGNKPASSSKGKSTAKKTQTSEKNAVLSGSLAVKNKTTAKQISSLKTENKSQNKTQKSPALKALKKTAEETKKTDPVTGGSRTAGTKQTRAAKDIGDVAKTVTKKATKDVQTKTVDDYVKQGTKGLDDMKESSTAFVKAVKKVAEKKKKDEENKLTKDERNKLQAATLSAANAERGQRYDTVKIDEGTREKLKWNTQREFDNASDGKKFLHGFASGAMPFTDTIKSIEKKYGIKVDEKKFKESGYYKTGDVLGFVASSMATGFGIEGVAAKTLGKAVTKVAGKKVAEKTGTKIATNIAADVAAGLPMNISDAAENTDSAKDFLKSLGINTALDVGVGGLINGVRLLKGVNKKEVQAVVDKVNAGKALDANDKEILDGIKEVAEQAEKRTKAVNNPKSKLATETKSVKVDETKDSISRKIEALGEAQAKAETSGATLDDIVKSSTKQASESYEAEIKKLEDYVYNYKGKGSEAHLVPTDKIDPVGGGEPFKVLQRASNNDPIYQEALKAFGKKPNKAQSREFAEEKIYEDIERFVRTGKTTWVEPEIAQQIVKASDLEDAAAMYKGGELKGIKVNDFETTLTYQKNKNRFSGIGKRLDVSGKTASEIKRVVPNPQEVVKKSRTINVDEVPHIKQTAAKLYKQADDDVAEIMEPWIRNGLMNKKVLASQQECLERAKAEMDDGLLYNSFMTSKVEDNEHLFMARAQVLMEDLMKRAPESDEAAEMLLNVMDKATEASSHAGRALNATKLLLRTTPEGRLRIFNREVDNLNKMFGGRMKGEKLKLSEEQIGRILGAETDEEIQAVSEQITKEMWENIPATWFEKFNEVRHFSMLFNPKTHIRNMFGNTIFKGGRMIAETMEVLAYKMPPIKNKLDKLGGDVQMVRVVRKDVKAHKDVLDDIFEKNYKHADSKNRYIEMGRPDDVSVVKNKALDRLIQTNYKLLEKEDLLILKPEYQKNFVRWCKANKIPLEKMSEMSPQQMQKANAYALRQAEYATFRDASALSSKIIGLKQKTATKQGKTALGTLAYRAGNVALESNLPFVKTPVNILRRSMDFSPVGLMRSTVELATAKTADDFMDGVKHMTTGLTGTGIFGFGMWLANQDLIMVKAGEESGDAYYDRDIGFQDYSLIINDKWSVTIDWVSPLQTSLFMGATAWNKMTDDGFSLSDMFDCLSALTGPMLDMSFMSSTKDTVEMFMETVYRNGTGDDANWSGAIYQSLFGSIPQGYLSSFVPQLFSQTAQATDKYQRDTRSTKEDPLAKSWESFGRKIANRIPGLRNYILNPKLDRFGDDKVTGNNVVLRFLNAYLNPASVKEIKLTKLDKEIIDIYNHLESEEDKKYFYYNFTGNPTYDLGDGKRMTYDEAYKYGKEKRRKQAGLIETMVKSKSYKNMTYKMKGDEVDDAHWLSQDVANWKTYGAKYAIKKISEFSEAEKNAYNKFKTLGGKPNEFMEVYVKKESLVARAHDTSYQTKALALATFDDERLAKAYGVYGDKMDAAKAYLKKGGSITEYSNAMCNIISTIQKMGGNSASMASKSLAAAEHDINSRTYAAMGMDSQLANMGAGLKKFGYDFQKLDAMEMSALAGFDADGNNSLKKAEVIAYIESLGLKSNAEKACIFRFFSDAKNPYGSIPNYLSMKDTSSSGSSGSSYRRYGSSRSGSSGSGSAKKTDFEKYSQNLLKSIQKGKFVDNPRYKKLDTSEYDSDAYRKAVTKLLAKKLKES